MAHTQPEPAHAQPEPAVRQDAPATNELQASLAGSKEARKRAELDAQLLANRIALLKQEEEKAWKKIEETRKRAQEITDLRTQNEQKFSAKEDFYKNKWDSIRQAQQQNQYNRDQAKAVRESTRNCLSEAKSANANRTKQESQQLLNQKKDREAAERKANTDRSNMVKQKKEEAKRKLEDDRLAQLGKFREDYEARAAQEELLRQRGTPPSLGKSAHAWEPQTLRQSWFCRPHLLSQKLCVQRL